MFARRSESLVFLSHEFKRNGGKVLSYLDVLEKRFNAREPILSAFVEEQDRFARVHREALALLDAYPDPTSRPPLFGIPVGIKDIFHVAGFATRAGSRLPPEVLTGQEAEAVAILKRAGALILGKTVCAEFACFAPGPTRNPVAPEHTPGGSSSGSAAAVGAGLVPLALGSQTVGSIGRPAAYCGVVGYKPSYDRISRQGVIPVAESVDHVGFFTTDIAGAILAASVLIAQWTFEPSSRAPVLGIPQGSYLKLASKEALEQFAINVAKLKAAGLKVHEVDAMPDLEQIITRHFLIMAAEAAQVHANWFMLYRDLYHQKTAELIERGKKIESDTLVLALRGRAQLRSELTELMDSTGIDAWIMPGATGAAPKGLSSTGDGIMSLPWSHAGLPTLTLPAGANADGLPLGLQIAGRWYADEAVLRWAQQIEAILETYVTSTPDNKFDIEGW